MSSTPANERSIAQQLGVSQGEVEAAWHQARTDSGVRQNPNAGGSTQAQLDQDADMMFKVMTRGK